MLGAGHRRGRAIAGFDDAGFDDAGHGYDVFGFHPPTLERVLALGRPIYDRYFGVTADGVEHIPAGGPVIVVANHAGVLPLDGILLVMNIDYETGRVARVVADHFVLLLPFVGTLLSRIGAVGGSRGNLRRLLESGELAVIFPEGVSGTGKDPADRYRLQEWRVGHAEFAIRHRAQVVPAAIIGSEEAWPMWRKLELGVPLPFDIPYLPVPRTPLPRPVPFRILYGAPIDVARGLEPGAADDPAIVAAAAARTRAAVAGLIERGLQERGAEAG